jgi:hypothetical protein
MQYGRLLNTQVRLKVGKEMRNFPMHIVKAYGALEM